MDQTIMRNNSQRDWKAYNIAKDRRFMERTAQLQVVPAKCQDCGGKGYDVGSVAEPEACPSCKGSGVEIPRESLKKGMGRAE